ncbi:DUF4142 domain-containing protein [Azoarcus sp. TTM-91]|uniref:DUF4142 domain-containing protein n=1 Tax=Azoarcus sp. TTM-91 TaxID=2691581 RepID=UPI00145CC4A3|nr:DUF4142 domain-containing protein [Azoarcus sp. TTM-91]NMG37234.1 DUF4142 domain-containing protein [Azoarcus sp. TTM-91]
MSPGSGSGGGAASPAGPGSSAPAVRPSLMTGLQAGPRLAYSSAHPAAHFHRTQAQVAPAAQPKMQLNQADARFVTVAMSRGLGEMEAGRIIAAGSTDARLKRFGERMVVDHQQANVHLAKLASARGVTVQEEIQDRERAQLDEMRQLSGPRLDAAFMRHFGVAAHQESIALFEQQVREGKDQELRAYADQRVKVLHGQLEELRKIQPLIADDGKGGR